MNHVNRQHPALQTAVLVAIAALAATGVWQLASRGRLGLAALLTSVALAVWFAGRRQGRQRGSKLARAHEISTLAFPPESRFGKGRGAPLD